MDDGNLRIDDSVRTVFQQPAVDCRSEDFCADIRLINAPQGAGVNTITRFSTEVIIKATLCEPHHKIPIMGKFSSSDI